MANVPIFHNHSGLIFSGSIPRGKYRPQTVATSSSQLKQHRDNRVLRPSIVSTEERSAGLPATRHRETRIWWIPPDTPICYVLKTCICCVSPDAGWHGFAVYLPKQRDTNLASTNRHRETRIWWGPPDTGKYGSSEYFPTTGRRRSGLYLSIQGDADLVSVRVSPDKGRFGSGEAHPTQGDTDLVCIFRHRKTWIWCVSPDTERDTDLVSITRNRETRIWWVSPDGAVGRLSYAVCVFILKRAIELSARTIRSIGWIVFHGWRPWLD